MKEKAVGRIHGQVTDTAEQKINVLEDTKNRKYPMKKGPKN